MKRLFNPQDQKVEYQGSEKSHRQLWREGNFVLKTDSQRLGLDWKEKMEKIVLVSRPQAFVDFIQDGYITKFIDGSDLHGNKVFSCDGSCLTSPFLFQKKIDVLSIFSQAVEIGKTLGFTFGDITCGNMIVSDTGVFLVDYDVIVDYPLASPSQRIWENTLRILFG